MLGQRRKKITAAKAATPLTKWRTTSLIKPFSKRVDNTAPHPPNEAFSVVDDENNIIFGVGSGVITFDRPNAVVLLKITPIVNGEPHVVDYTFMDYVDETMQEPLVQKTVKTMLKFGFFNNVFNNGYPSYHIVTLDKPISRANGQEQWHQDSLNISFLKDDIKEKLQPILQREIGIKKM